MKSLILSGFFHFLVRWFVLVFMKSFLYSMLYII